ncbi:2Fe-2S iron-sulfur cluster-binding protein [Segetibacter koreensis]|uniref:2Fe-2S iron-sulfur cluster-binding protein n=1 Tax=Segetibacter koreensis TaxID=398037 RepID=UPI00037B8C9D|nr:2Fe-2S iron-sulfur cluster-binding protein [Segetibacter koreensis]
MAINKTYIHFTAYYQGEKYELQTYEGEYRNLMVLLYDKIYIEDFGECKGMGRCGTCVVKVEGLPAGMNTLERNEERTLYKMGIQSSELRLACQILVDENLKNINVEIIGGESLL